MIALGWANIGAAVAPDAAWLQLLLLSWFKVETSLTKELLSQLQSRFLCRSWSLPDYDRNVLPLLPWFTLQTLLLKRRLC